MRYLFSLFLPFIILLSCQGKKDFDFFDQIDGLEKIKGNEEYRHSPFLSAGQRAYIVGNQSGKFPEIGWHIPGEMGGLWLPPIKLLDGYHAEIKKNDLHECLTDATYFYNYPIGSEHIFELEKLGLKFRQFHFVPETSSGAIIAYQVENMLNVENQFEFTFSAAIDLRPVWLSDSLSIVDGDDEGSWNKKNNIFLAKDNKNGWFTALGGRGFETSNSENLCKTPRKGRSFDQALSRSFKIEAGKDRIFYFFVSGSESSQEEAEKAHRFLSRNVERLLEEKMEIYQDVDQITKLNTPDEGFNQMFRWLKYNAKWLMQEVPGIGNGLVAGSPDYPWWFGTDMGYAIQGLLSAGMHQEALSSIDLMVNLSEKVNGKSGKIIHEASTNGVIYNSGNLNTTPKFVSMLWKAFAWTGDKAILDYYELVKKAVSWVESQDTNGNSYPDGAGMMEIQGLETEMIDVVSYQYEMYLAAANFAKVKQDEVLANEYLVKAARLKRKINSEWWVEEFNSYADFRATKAVAVNLIENAIIRADTLGRPQVVIELQKALSELILKDLPEIEPFVLYHNWIVNTPMEVGVADHDKAILALKTAENYSSRFGMFVTGIDGDKMQDKASKWKSFSYVGAVMTLPTGVQAIAEAKYGNPDRALEYLKMMQNSFSYALPGSMYEVSPDFGMMTQAWNIYAVAVPVVEEFLGINPKAWKNEIMIRPKLPSKWNDVSLQNIRIGDNSLDISIKKIDNMMEVKISQRDNWKLVFEFPEAKYIVYDGNKIKGGKVELYDRVHNLKIAF